VRLERASPPRHGWPPTTETSTPPTLAERVVAREAETDGLNRKAGAWLTLAEVRRAAGRAEEAEAAVAEALALYEQRGNVAAAERLRAPVAGGA
jgi:hypothetical protein